MLNPILTDMAPLDLIRQHPRRILEAIRVTDDSDAGRRALFLTVLRKATEAVRPLTGKMTREMTGDLMAAIEWKDAITEAFLEDSAEKAAAEAHFRGAIGAKITDLMKVLAVRDLHPTKKQLARVAACTDVTALDRWFDRSLVAASAKEVFAD